MKPQQTTKHLIDVTLFLIILCAPVWAQPIGRSFFDDFSDGNPRDGSPVNWRQLQRGYAPNNYTLTAQGLEFSNSVATAANSDGSDYVYGDVSVTAQIRRVGSTPTWQGQLNWLEGDYCAIAARCQGDLADNSYWATIVWPGLLQVGYNDGWTQTKWETDLSPLNVQAQDLVLRLDAIGDRIQVWCWAAEEPMPDAPQLSISDARYTTGSVAILGENDPGAKWLVRWVEVTDGTIVPEPILDFNGNGTVDIRDLVQLIESWGHDDPSVDIVPDGVVDVNDLEVLMDSWHQDVNDPTLMAHWKLDETAGDVAYESAAALDANVMGEAVWKSAEGQIEGALAFDGINDCIETPFVLDPSETVFSVFAWIKGGSPGQVILSQADGSNWLISDASGNLATDLKGAGGRSSHPLHSDTLIIDDLWHRIGLVWDGSYRSLYVDDEIVATDETPQANFPSATGGLCLGAQSTLDPGTFWSGLMDDVRIYNRVVEP